MLLVLEAQASSSHYNELRLLTDTARQSVVAFSEERMSGQVYWPSLIDKTTETVLQEMSGIDFQVLKQR